MSASPTVNAGAENKINRIRVRSRKKVGKWQAKPVLSSLTNSISLEYGGKLQTEG